MSAQQLSDQADQLRATLETVDVRRETTANERIEVEQPFEREEIGRLTETKVDRSLDGLVATEGNGFNWNKSPHNTRDENNFELTHQRK